MNTIHITASREYDVLVQRGGLDDLGTEAARVLKPGKAALVTDDRVFPHYGGRARQALESAGFSVTPIVIPHGEQHKTLDTLGTVLEALCDAHLTRSDCIVALGGGVVGDLAGFAAAVYLRGIPYIQVPTTLLAMVDSSVGGKTAVDLPGGKNQAGAFYQPSLVLCDPAVLDTLPEEEFRCGCAEIIKYGLLGNEPFFRSLQRTPIRNQLETVITTCVQMKRDVVAADEFDRGVRQKLNLGHSFGHAVEQCSGFTLLHGQAVAIGMAAITRAAFARGICSRETLEDVLSILRAYDLPTETSYPLDELARAALSDKKMAGGTMHLIVPEAVGRCRIQAIPAGELRDWMASGGLK